MPIQNYSPYTAGTVFLNAGITLPLPLVYVPTNGTGNTFGTATNHTPYTTPITWTTNTITTSGALYTAGAITAVNWTLTGSWIAPVEEKEKIPRNHRAQPLRSYKKDQLFSDVPQEELIALQLLKKIVEPAEFKRYLKHGFINVRGKSGLIYQVPRSGQVIVWDNGTMIASLCIHVGRGIPPSDEVVAKMLIIEGHEPDIWHKSNVGQFISGHPKVAQMRQAA